jgi:hypothetical protein
MPSLALIDRLEDIQQTSPDSWRCRCPAHEGRSRSLAVKDTGGTLLLKCFAGCTVLEIVESVGLTLSDLFDKSTPYSPALARKHQMRTSARHTLEAIMIPVRVLTNMGDVSILRKLTDDEMHAYVEASRTVNRALDIAINDGVIQHGN